MKPYGKSTTYWFSCRCCSINVSPRQQAKRELQQILKDEMDDTEYTVDYYDSLDEDMYIYPAKVEDYGIEAYKYIKKHTCGVCGKLDDPDCVQNC